MDFFLSRFLIQCWHAMLCLLLASGIPTVGMGQENAALQRTERDALQELAGRYRIKMIEADAEFPVRITSGVIQGAKPKSENVESYLRIFHAEFSLYPVEFVRKSRLRRVVFCENLAFSGQLRTALPDFENNTLYLDVGREIRNSLYLRKVIHHEYFHLIDYQDDGLVYEDENWSQLNPASFRYGTGGKNAQHISDTATLTDKYPGFLNHYSTTGVEEDKAEIFANMVVCPSHLNEASQRDPHIAKKAQRMKELLQTFSSDLDETFWTNARELSR